MRYPPATPASVIPPPPGPPPAAAAALGPQPAWRANYGRVYDARGPVSLHASGQHQSYNPTKFHAHMAVPPPPPRQSDAMSATYIPTGETYGEGVGIPVFGVGDSAAQAAGADANAATALEDAAARDRLYVAAHSRGLSNAAGPVAAGSIHPDVVAQWPLDTVLIWLAHNQFSKDWQETFKALNLHGLQFLELGSLHGGRGNFGMMHQKVYPRLAQECVNSGSGWDQPREREEGKRMRRLIRSIVTGKPVDQSKMTTSHARKESVTAPAGNSLPSAGTDPADSPNVSPSTSLTPNFGPGPGPPSRSAQLALTSF